MEQFTNYENHIDDYHIFNKNDRFTATYLGYSLTFRVSEIKIDFVRYELRDGTIEISQEPIIITKSGMVWTSHVCGALLEFYGRGQATYSICPAKKTWVSMRGPLKKGEKTLYPYALGES